MSLSVETQKQLRHRIRSKWQKLAPHLYWGDDLDVRYHLAGHLKTVRDRRVLDLGCGPGFLLMEVPDNSLRVGFDLNLEAISIATQHRGKDKFFLLASLLDLPFRDGAFDLCIMANVLPGWSFSVEGQPEKQRFRVIEECRRVVADEGEVWVTMVNGDSPIYVGLSKATPRAFRRVVDPFFAITSMIYWNPFTTMVFFIPRALLALIPRGVRRWTYIPPRLLERLPWIDALLALCGERWRISRGRHFFARMTPR